MALPVVSSDCKPNAFIIGIALALEELVEEEDELDEVPDSFNTCPV